MDLEPVASCDSLCIMKFATVADLRNKFALVSRWIYEGESVTIKKRGRVFAILNPVKKKQTPLAWPPFEERLQRHFPQGALKVTGTKDVIDEIRGNY